MPDTEGCSVAGSLSAGAICATSNGLKRDMNMMEFLEFLEPTQERAGAICESASDFNAKKTALEQACRRLGKRCSYEVKAAIQKMAIQQKELGAIR